ncbi:MAG: LacI family DNA-binding transcriptional regulator, partial [Candidatus Sumerlaeota bacterium]
MARITLTQVARHAGVSAPTASAVLHNTAGNNSGFSKKTKEKVLAAAEELGYRPNRTTRNFYRKRHGQIGMVVARDGWLPGETLEAMSRAARRNDQMLVIERGSRSRDELPICVAEDAADGLILIGDIEENLEEAVKKLKMPVVHVNSNRRRVPGAITYDEQGGMARAVEHLAVRGRRHIGFITEPIDPATHYSVRERWIGLVKACEDAGLAKPPVLELENIWLSRLYQPLKLLDAATEEIRAFIEKVPL